MTIGKMSRTVNAGVAMILIQVLTFSLPVKLVSVVIYVKEINLNFRGIICHREMIWSKLPTKRSHLRHSAVRKIGNSVKRQNQFRVKKKNFTATDYKRSISLKDESLASEGESMKRAEKRRRRRSTIRMTAKQTQEIHHSTSFTSPKGSNTTSDTTVTGYVSCDDELLMKSDSPKKHYISRVNIFVVARAVHRVGSAGEMVKAEDPPCAQCVTIPSSAALIQPEIFNSGLAFSSGKKFRVVSLLNFYCVTEESLVKFSLVVSILSSFLQP